MTGTRSKKRIWSRRISGATHTVPPFLDSNIFPRLCKSPSVCFTGDISAEDTVKQTRRRLLLKANSIFFFSQSPSAAPQNLLLTRWAPATQHGREAAYRRPILHGLSKRGEIFMGLWTFAGLGAGNDMKRIEVKARTSRKYIQISEAK